MKDGPILDRNSIMDIIEGVHRSPEKFLSFYKEIMDAQHFEFYIILSNYVWTILSYQTKDHNVRHIRFQVCIKMRCLKRRVCKGKTLSGQPSTFIY